MSNIIQMLDFKKENKMFGESLKLFIKSKFDKHFIDFDSYDVFRNINNIVYVISKDGEFGYGIGEMQIRQSSYSFLDNVQYIRGEQRVLSQQNGFESDFDLDFAFDKERNLCGFRFKSSWGNKYLMGEKNEQ